MNDLICQHLLRAQQRMKNQAYKGRTERSFEVGMWVYLKLQPYIQSSLAPRAKQKLLFKFFGPFQILAKIGSVAYKLALPPSSSIHPVFHVSQLKLAVPATHIVAPELPNTTTEFQVPAILQTKYTAHGNSTVTQALVKWSGMSSALAT